MKVREPVKLVHNGYTPTSAPQRVRDLLPDEEEALLENRFVFINVWSLSVGQYILHLKRCAMLGVLVRMI